MKFSTRQLASHSSDLLKELSECEEQNKNSCPNPSRTLDIIRSIGSLTCTETSNKNTTKTRSKMTTEILLKTGIGKVMNSTLKMGRRYSRSEKNLKSQHKGSGVVGTSWSEVVTVSDQLLKTWKKIAKDASKNEEKTQDKGCDSSDESVDEHSNTGLPRNSKQYRARLLRHKKDLYKDPPQLPGPSVEIEAGKAPLPKRKKNGDLVFDDWEDFQPNTTPKEVLHEGAFGGTYFRSIVSSVTNISYNGNEVMSETMPKDWIEGLDRKTRLTSKVYRKDINKYGVKCGGSLGMWESSGWISDSDPYGWFQVRPSRIFYKLCH
mmetsp:Transcript_20815/g.47263  ORF Transcript_20815/g.47263 Transcript_20815/m.47263 type:complete len:320 (-) Transcript_20815:341-1300(-)